MRIQSIVFDFDDTLVRTYQLSYTKHANTARVLGLNVPSEEEFLKWHGLPWIELVRNLWPNIPFEVFQQAHVRSKNETYPIISGARETLTFCKNRKLLLGLLTTRDDYSLKMVAEENSLDLAVFDFVFTRTNNAFHKPDSRVFNPLLSKLSARGISKHETVYVGDSVYDFQAARSAGLQFIGVLTGPARKQDFLSEGLNEGLIVPSIHYVMDCLTANDWVE